MKRAYARAIVGGRCPTQICGEVTSHEAFGCAGRFAYASGVVVDDYEEVVLFMASGGRWETADRGKYCLNHEAPSKIYKGVCTTS